MIDSELPQYITATILDLKLLLKPKKCKEIIIESMRFLVENKRVFIYAFVILDLVFVGKCRSGSVMCCRWYVFIGLFGLIKSTTGR